MGGFAEQQYSSIVGSGALNRHIMDSRSMLRSTWGMSRLKVHVTEDAVVHVKG